MKIPGFPSLKRLGNEKVRKKAMRMLTKAGIKKSVRVIQAEYYDYCDRNGKEPSARDKTGFLSVMNMLADDDAKQWIDDERTRLDKIIEEEENANNNGAGTGKSQKEIKGNPKMD